MWFLNIIHKKISFKYKVEKTKVLINVCVKENHIEFNYRLGMYPFI